MASPQLRMNINLPAKDSGVESQLFMHSANSLISQGEHLTTSILLAAWVHLPHAIAVRSHVHEVGIVILTPETAGLIWCLSRNRFRSVGLSIPEETANVARSSPPGQTTMWELQNLPAWWGIKEGARWLWYSELGLHQLHLRR